MPEDRFWKLVAEINWSELQHKKAEWGEKLAREISLADCIGAHQRLFAFSFALKSRLEAWERAGQPSGSATTASAIWSTISSASVAKSTRA
jgi:hypothetical protein